MKTTVYIPDELRAAIRSTARREGRSQSEVIRAALAEYLAGSEKPRPSSIGAASEPGVAGRNLAKLRERWAAERTGRRSAER